MPVIIDDSGVDWGALRHAHGSAANVPALLLAICDRDANKRATAWNQLWGALIQQGKRYNASAAAIPFLANHAADPKKPGRVEVLKFLVHLAAGHPDGNLRSGTSAKSISEHARSLRSMDADAADAAEACYAAGAQCVNTFVKLTRDASPRVREHAAFACAWFPAQAEQSVSALEMALGDEKERMVASAVIALGYLGRTETGGYWSTLLTHASPLVRLSVAIARVRLAKTPPPEALAILVEHKRNRSSISPGDFAWPRLDALADDLAMSHDTALWEKHVSDTIDFYRTHRNSTLYLKDLIERVFPDLANAGPPSLPSAMQRRLLEAIAIVEFPEQRWAYTPTEPWHYVELDTWRSAAVMLTEFGLPRTQPGLAALERGDPAWRETDEANVERLFLSPSNGRKPLIDEATDAFQRGARPEAWSLLAIAFGPAERVTSAPKRVTALDETQKRVLRTILSNRFPWQNRGERIAKQLARWKLPCSRGALRAFLNEDPAWAKAPTEDLPAREDTEPERFEEQLNERIAEMKATPVYRAYSFADELLDFVFGTASGPIDHTTTSRGQRAALRAIAETDAFWPTTNTVRDRDFAALLKRYELPDDQRSLKHLGALR